jgi:hypothetical protein
MPQSAARSLPVWYLDGVYTIQQRSSGRYVDAWDRASEDYRVVTRPRQDNSTQRWEVSGEASVVTIQQVSTGRYLDAWELFSEDFRVVTRTRQNNDSQRWVVLNGPSGGEFFRQLSIGRFLDAYESGEDYRLITRLREEFTLSQVWLRDPVVVPQEDEKYWIRQRSTFRYMDAYENGQDYQAVTRSWQENTSQQWNIEAVGRVYTIRQVSTGRFIHAYDSSGTEFGLATRPREDSDPQYWVALPADNGSLSLQQLGDRRFMDAFENSNDHQLITRERQNNDTQRWVFRKV